MPGRGDKEIIDSYEQDISRMGAIFNLTFKESEKKELLKLFTKEEILQKEGREYIVSRAMSDIAKANDVELHRRLYRIYSFKSGENEFCILDVS